MYDVAMVSYLKLQRRLHHLFLEISDMKQTLCRSDARLSRKCVGKFFSQSFFLVEKRGNSFVLPPADAYAYTP